MTGRRITAKDVARHAGVAQSTVSYVLNDTPGQTIPEATRAKVRRAVEELGYTPSAAARALRRGTSESVLLLLPDAPIGESIAQFIEGIAAVIEQAGLSAVFRRHVPGSDCGALVAELMPAAVANLSALTTIDEAAIIERGIPVAGIPLPTDGSGPDLAQEQIGRLQAQHLIERGHTRIAYAASTDPLVEMFGRHRLAGVRRECELRGLPEPLVEPVTLEVNAAARVIGALALREPRPTAIAAHNDDVAFAVLAGMRQRGLIAPHDLAVVGVDNIPLSALAVPPLTTIDFNPRAVGQQIGNAILHKIRPSNSEPAETPRETRLVIRATT
ncbi:MAG: LacI family transcriptional regulator [Promicromonosporaceae bacterium]|nr:LacI family transcriptional regulator [Promicromonosporaceae bacterium]